MKVPIPSTDVSHFTVVMRFSGSLVRIPENKGILISPIESPFGHYQLSIRQRAEKVPHIQVPIPRELWVEATGPAPSVDVAIHIAATCANEYVRQLAFAANAWQGLLFVHLAYESGPQIERRKFLQNWIVDERGLPRVARYVDPDLMHEVQFAIARLPEKDRSRVQRAVVQYSDALQHWKPGNELYALAHLYMGVEAITPLIIRREVERRGFKDRSGLERELNGPPADRFRLRLATRLYQWAGGYISSRLEPWARREIVFEGDRETYAAAQKASNHYEHGASHHSEIQPLATKSMGRTARYLRKAILSLINLEVSSSQQLVDGTYAEPLGAGGFERQIRGVLVSDSAKDGLNNSYQCSA